MEKIPLSKVYSKMTLLELYEYETMLMGLWQRNMENQEEFEKCLNQLVIEIKNKLESHFNEIDLNS
jgi:hypothetical protein